jgi:hypothetical protein
MMSFYGQDIPVVLEAREDVIATLVQFGNAYTLEINSRHACAMWLDFRLL